MKYAQGLRKFFYILLGGGVVLPAAALDLERAKEVYGPCAACHGPFGAGGKQGEYPRITGQSPKYVEQQLPAFQSQLRINLPMYPYTQARHVPDAGGPIYELPAEADRCLPRGESPA